ncbi:MAG: DUF4349 domain-containing protein [Mucilaginibacter sp.]
MKTRILIVVAAALGLLAACKGKSGSYEFVNNGKGMSAAADSVLRVDSAKVPAVKLVKTAEINFKVKDVRKVGDDIASLTTQYGGMVMHHQVQSTAGTTRDVHISNDSIMRIAAFNTTGEMTVRVPSAKLEDYMTKVSRLGVYVNVSRMDIEDKTLEYLSSQLKLKDREELVSQQKSGKIKIKSPTDVLLLKDDMVDQKIEGLRTDAAVRFSVISLNFYQSDTISKERVANDDPSTYNIPFGQRMSLAFANGWAIFVDVLVGMTNIWMVILTGLVAWRLLVYYRRKVHPAGKPANPSA